MNPSAWSPLRQPLFRTAADRVLEERVLAFHVGDQPPVVSHWIAGAPADGAGEFAQEG
jgi:hypothetical protein